MSSALHQRSGGIVGGALSALSKSLLAKRRSRGYQAPARRVRGIWSGIGARGLSAVLSGAAKRALCTSGLESLEGCYGDG